MEIGQRGLRKKNCENFGELVANLQNLLRTKDRQLWMTWIKLIQLEVEGLKKNTEEDSRWTKEGN